MPPLPETKALLAVKSAVKTELIAPAILAVRRASTFAVNATEFASPVATLLDTVFTFDL